MVNDSPGSVEAVLVLAGGGERAVPPTGLTIGRAEDAGLMLPDPLVSHRHAQITMRENAYSLADLGSLNGTRLNGNVVTAPTVLCDGDTIQLAGTTLTIRIRRIAVAPKPRSHTVLALVPEPSPQPPESETRTVSLGEATKTPRLGISVTTPSGTPAAADVALTGVLDIETAEQFRDQATRLVEDGFTNLSIDLDHLQYMDSSGLSALVGLLRTVKPLGGHLRLRNAQPIVRGIIELTRLDQILALE